LSASFQWPPGACSGTGNCTMKMDSPRSVTATFNLSTPPTITLPSPGGQTGAEICYPQTDPSLPGTSCSGNQPPPTNSGNFGGNYNNPPGTFSVSSGAGDAATATTSLTGSSGPYTYVHVAAGASPQKCRYSLCLRLAATLFSGVVPDLGYGHSGCECVHER
jgi:hypothetical protein